MQLYFDIDNEAGAIAKIAEINTNLAINSVVISKYAIANRDHTNKPQYKVLLTPRFYEAQFDAATNDLKNLFFYATILSFQIAASQKISDLIYSSSILEIWINEVQTNSDLLDVKNACNL